jgi:hypothetical protein
MNYFKVCSDALISLDSTSLRFRPKTSEPVDNGRIIAESFEKSSKAERLQILAAVSPSLAMKLLGLSGFMAEAAINSRDNPLIRLSVLLHVVEDFRKDCRENYRYLALIAYASNQLGIDFKDQVESVESVVSERSAKHLKEFIFRGDDLNNLGSFGIKADVSGGVFRFMPM